MVDYHGLDHRYMNAHGLLMQPQLNGGTLGRRVAFGSIPASGHDDKDISQLCS
jgi:hypothetical protein